MGGKQENSDWFHIDPGVETVLREGERFWLIRAGHALVVEPILPNLDKRTVADLAHDSGVHLGKMEIQDGQAYVLSDSCILDVVGGRVTLSKTNPHTAFSYLKKWNRWAEDAQEQLNVLELEARCETAGILATFLGQGVDVKHKDFGKFYLRIITIEPEV